MTGQGKRKGGVEGGPFFFFCAEEEGRVEGDKLLSLLFVSAVGRGSGEREERVCSLLIIHSFPIQNLTWGEKGERRSPAYEPPSPLFFTDDRRKRKREKGKRREGERRRCRSFSLYLLRKRGKRGGGRKMKLCPLL